MFFKTAALKKFAIFTGKHLCWSVFLINLQVWRPAALLKRDSSPNFSREYCEVFKDGFIYRTPLVAASKILGTPFQKLWTIFMATQPTFQRQINVSMLCINDEITLIGRWKWNKIRRWIFNVVQRWYNVSAGRWNNVGTTSLFNLASTLVKTIVNPIGLEMIMDLQIHE